MSALLFGLRRLSPSFNPLGCLCLVLVLALDMPGAQAAPLDLMERSAPDNPQASQAVLMDVTRAGNDLVAVGERGIVLLSGDNGKSWQQAEVPVSVALTGVRFIDERKGWAIGHSGVVLHTIDAGKRWTRQLDGLSAARIEVAAAERSEDPRRQRNADRLLADGADKPWLDVLFVDDRRGWLLGAYGLLLVTEDGGATWQSAMGQIDNPGGLHLYAIAAVGERLIIAGEQGSLFQSTDGGRNFSRLDSPYEGSFFGLTATRRGDVLLYGLRGNVWRLAAGGEATQALHLAHDVSLTANLYTSDGTLLLADEAGRLSYSRDDGGRFKTMPVDPKGYVAGLAETADGALVTVGVRGVQRIELAEVLP